MVTVECLKPNTTYTTSIIANYRDGAEAESDIKCDFCTPGMFQHTINNMCLIITHCPIFHSARVGPSDIKVIQKYPGSWACTVLWSFDKETTDLNGFRVTVETGGEVLETIKCNVPNCKSSFTSKFTNVFYNTPTQSNLVLLSKGLFQSNYTR